LLSPVFTLAGQIDVKELHVGLLLVYDKLNKVKHAACCGSECCCFVVVLLPGPMPGKGAAAWAQHVACHCIITLRQTSDQSASAATSRRVVVPCPPLLLQTLPVYLQPPEHGTVQALLRKYDGDASGHLNFEVWAEQMAVCSTFVVYILC
jgi:hypothetical protein